MLARSLWKLLATMSDNSKIIKTNHHINELKENRRNKTTHFRIKMDRISDSLYFMELINNQHPLSQTNKMLQNIVRGSTPINRNNFDTIFKKYSFYIQHIHEKKGYTEAGFNDKINFLDNVTQVYSKLGQLSAVNMIKTFNKVSNQIYSQIRSKLKNQPSPDTREQFISQLVLTICCIGRYNKKKSISCLRSVQKFLVNHKYLSRMSWKTAILYMELFSKLKVYNRLIIQVCIDTLKDRVLELNIQDLNKTLYCLASSQYPVNKTFVISITKRITKQLNKQMDPNSGIPFAKNQFAVRQNLRMLQSLSLLEVNMNLASAYLSEITNIYEIQLFELSNYLHRMNDKDLQYYSGLLRRSSFYDESLLKSLISEVISRKIRQLEDLDFDQSKNQMKKQKNKDKKISINTLCSILHTLAVYNYRNQGLIEYFIKTVEILIKKQKLKQINTNKNETQKNLMNIFSNGNLLQEQLGVINLIQPKYYSRVIWALCVIAQKQEIAQIYPFFEYFFIQHYQLMNETPQTHQLLNFYYCYLLLKTYFPKHKLSFQNLLKSLQNKQLESKISLTHAQIHEQFISAGIPALRQHNINNLLCDIFVPQYTSQNGKYEAVNVIIDVHGHHHFMRNCDRLRGNGTLKQKILQNQGYIYQFIGVHEWELANNKKQFITALMDKIAQKWGQQIKNKTKRAQKLLNGLGSNKQDGLILAEELQNQKEQETTSKIKLEKKRGRSFRTNSLKLSNK